MLPPDQMILLLLITPLMLPAVTMVLDELANCKVLVFVEFNVTNSLLYRFPLNMSWYAAGTAGFIVLSV